MHITLSPDLEERIAKRVERGDIVTTDLLVEQALNFYLDYEEGEMDQAEFSETKAAVDDAIEQGERGEGRPAEEVFASLRAKYGVSR